MRRNEGVWRARIEEDDADADADAEASGGAAGRISERLRLAPARSAHPATPDGRGRLR